MLDPHQLRDQLRSVVGRLTTRGFTLDVTHMESLEGRREAVQIRIQKLQAERNVRSKTIDQITAKNSDYASRMAEGGRATDELAAGKAELDAIQAELTDFLLTIPNLPDPVVPAGRGQDDNVEVRRWGMPRQLDFEIKDSVFLGTLSGGLDLDAAYKLSGAHFSLLRGPIARLHRALAQFMIEMHASQHGYEETYVPCVVRGSALQCTGLLPRLEEDLFRVVSNGTASGYLIPSGDVALMNLVAGKILDAKQLPLKLLAHTPCFRNEAGRYGRDTRVTFREYQADEVALVNIVEPSASMSALEEMVVCGERVLQCLELPYRIRVVCTGDLRFSALKSYDLEVWMPSMGRYRTIGSFSNAGDFLARRMLACSRTSATSQPKLVHTVSSSGMAVGILLKAILENHQQVDGRIRIPGVLQPMMGGETV
ncbi:seryl-tRNA synthetase [Pseudomonas putida]|uniref:serine--tRNA ligase n=1 Tax=Pseudomonas putida TaxID=303 RepID=UPI0010460B7D|nr:serine--tRNA ligase [Pseudomonas putida]TCP75869.1 seryl-tRNA synthetase [Pseudomonas putida]